HIAPFQLTADDPLASGINTMYLKDRLGDVETDCRNCLHAWLAARSELQPFGRQANIRAGITPRALRLGHYALGHFGLRHFYVSALLRPHRAYGRNAGA